MVTDFYVFLNSKDSSDAFPNNTYTDFTTSLPTLIELPSSNACGDSMHWSVALTDICLHTSDAFSNIYSISALCDIVEESYLKGGFAPILRILSGDAVAKGSLHTPYYISVAQKTFSSIRIALSEINGKTLPPYDSNTTLSCTLHFQPVLH